MILKQELRKIIARHLVNYPGWRTHRKIVVIESDDWGSIRMPSKTVYDSLLKRGIQVNISPYNRVDSLADATDLTSLFDVLSSVKDKNGNHPIFTANSVVANPNFERIKASDYSSYSYEPFTETLKRDKRTENAFSLWQEGMSARIFYPQFHGREHLNVARWMRDLRDELPDTRLAFDYGCFGLASEDSSFLKKSYMAAMDYDSKEDQHAKNEIIESGLILFKKIFGYSSKSYIATNYIWGDELNEILFQNGVLFIQGQKKQGHPQIDKTTKYVRRILGEKNEFGQTYLIRNCIFEPSQYPNIDSVEYCLHDIQSAFFWHKPAIISSHRLNFMGGIVPDNRDNNLKSLNRLLQKITRKWPDVEFMSSDQLGNLIKDHLPK
jgi:hypothetical protein